MNSETSAILESLERAATEVIFASARAPISEALEWTATIVAGLLSSLPVEARERALADIAQVARTVVAEVQKEEHPYAGA